MPILTAVCLLVGAMGQQPEAEMQKLTSDFLGLETKLMGAAQLKDAEKGLPLISPEFAFSVALEARPSYVMNRSEWIRGHQHYDLKHFSISDLTAHALSEDAVLTHFRLVRSAQMGQGLDVSGEWVVTDVWVRTNDEWQVWRRFVSRPVVIPARK